MYQLKYLGTQNTPISTSLLIENPALQKLQRQAYTVVSRLIKTNLRQVNLTPKYPEINTKQLTPRLPMEPIKYLKHVFAVDNSPFDIAYPTTCIAIINKILTILRSSRFEFLGVFELFTLFIGVLVGGIICSSFVCIVYIKTLTV